MDAADERVFQERMDQQDWHNRMRRRYSYVKAAAAFAIGFFVPMPWVLMYGAAMLTWMAIGLWSVRPGRCLICRRSTHAGIGRDFQVWPWWQMRQPGPRPDYWACPEHFYEIVLYVVKQEENR